MWHETGHRAEVTCILRSPQKDHFAVGYADGSIRLWSASSSSVLATFNGHKKAVTALAFDESGTRLASGSQDTDLILWDVVGEAGLYRYVLVSICAFIFLLTSSQLARPPGPNYCDSFRPSRCRLCTLDVYGDYPGFPPDRLQGHVPEAMGPFNPTLHPDHCCSPFRSVDYGPRPRARTCLHR